MFRRAQLTVLLVLVGYCFAAIPGRTEEPSAKPKASQPKEIGDLDELFANYEKQKAETAKRVPEWKKKYAFQSLDERLKYEASARSDSAPTLSQDATKRLDDSEAYLTGSAAFVNLRADSLKMLHAQEVQEFVERSGFGISRTPRPGPQYVELSKQRLEELVKLPPPSAEELNLLPTTILREDRGVTASPTAMTQFLPSRHEMHAMLDRSVDNFAGSLSFGWIKSRNEVAGFESHQFTQQPWTPPDATHNPVNNGPYLVSPDQRYWKLARLELVSLLKHATPCVYESDQLPTMEELSSANAKTRSLAAFETVALEKLRGGDDIHTASTPNRIVMLGAIRANKACLQCHEVPRGTLLGAFSYELRRDPPIAIEKSTAPVQ